MKENIILPCLTGKFGSWRYYNVVMKIKDLVNPNGGVRTVPEAKKIYSSDNLNEILQRLEDPSRIEPIKNYILKQKDRYFNSLTVAIEGGDPKWYPVSIREDSKFSKKNTEYLNLKFGILELSGEEELFILDGQHRLLGLKSAFESNPEIGNEEMSVMLVNYEDTVEGKKRIRRIFVSLNRNAKPVSEGENIILEEDDISAILARQTVEKYSLFKSKNVIAFNKNLNLRPGKNDSAKFTSILALYNINEILIDRDKVYGQKIEGKHVVIRPEDKIIETNFKEITKFWDAFFTSFTDAKLFIQDPISNGNFKTDFGGFFFLKPIGQEVAAMFYQHLRAMQKVEDFTKLQLVEKKLKSSFWNYILYNPHKQTIIMNKVNAFTYLLYNFGYPVSRVKLLQLQNSYRKNSGELQLSLPEPQYI